LRADISRNFNSKFVSFGNRFSHSKWKHRKQP
jgi:hypothetical protein